MAALPPSYKVKENEYTNWLKVTLALYYMKLGLHNFINTEVDSLHETIFKKIYDCDRTFYRSGYETAWPPCTMCDAKCVRRNKRNGTWEFKKRCNSDCDVWFKKLLELHVAETSDKIYWDNSHVPSWTLKAWECAKVFMPRGQTSTNTGPTKCDAHALLTLMSNCKHFHHRLSPQGLVLTRTISDIRNRVMHDGEMKLSDADKTNCIQQIIQLLEDPVILKELDYCRDAVGNIQKIDNESLDIFFNLDIEVKGLRAAVNEFRLKLGLMEKETLDTVDTLKEEFKKHREQKETTVQKRIESDGLRQLKNQTEDILDTFRKGFFIPTVQTKEAKQLLKEKRSIVIKGNPGEGKTSTALYLIDYDDYINQRLVVNCPGQWDSVDTDWVKIVILEDIFGQYDLDPSRLKEWVIRLPIIQKHVDVGKLQVIITTRDDILLKAYSELMLFKLFKVEMSVTLSSEKLQVSDKMSILNRTLQIQKKEMGDGQKKQCISNFSGLIGFPQCCSLFAGDMFGQGPDFFKSPEKCLVDNIMKLDPNSFLSLAFLFCCGEIDEKYLSSSQREQPNKYRTVLKELALYLNISFNKSTMTRLRESYNLFARLYVKRVSSHEIHSARNAVKSCIQFSHATVYDAVGQVLSNRCLEIVVKYGDSEYLYQRTYTVKAKEGTSQSVFIPVSVYGLLAERMIHDVLEKTLVNTVVKHSAFKHDQFLMILKDELLRGNRIGEFVMADLIFLGQDLSNGGCITFLQHVLKSNDDTVKLVYSHFIEFLACTHYNQCSDCLKCKEKQRLLELALYYHHFQIADKLITMNACYTHVSLCNASRHSELGRVQAIIKTIKLCDEFAPECRHAKKALCNAYISGNQNMIKLLLNEGITLDSCHVVDVVKLGDMNALMEVVQHLKCHQKWNPNQNKRITCESDEAVYSRSKHMFLYRYRTYTETELYIAYCHEKFDMADYLVTNGIEVSMFMLTCLSEDSSQQAVAKAIQHLKDAGRWDSNCNHASDALENAFVSQKYDVCNVLIDENVSLTMKTLRSVVRRFGVPLESVKNAVKYLKDKGNWDGECDEARDALKVAFVEEMHDVSDILIQEGISLTIKDLHGVLQGPLNCVKIALQHLKETGIWNPNCDDASEVLAIAFRLNNHDVCDLLIDEKVTLSMKNLPYIIGGESVMKAIHLKDAGRWDSNCNHASDALEIAFVSQKYDVCNVLIDENVSLTMKTLRSVVRRFGVPLESVKNAVKYLKDKGNWDGECDEARDALQVAFVEEMHDVSDILIQEGISLTIKDLHGVLQGPLNCVKIALQHLKETGIWNPNCDDASEVLAIAFRLNNHDVCDLLIDEKVTLSMKNLPYIIGGESVMKAIQYLKDTERWDAQCDYVLKAFNTACWLSDIEVCDLLFKERVPLTMKNFSFVMTFGFWELAKKLVQYLKETDSWDPKCDEASEALDVACMKKEYSMCNLLFQEILPVTMKDMCTLIGKYRLSVETVKKVIQYLKDNDNWDPRCIHVSNALPYVYAAELYDVCDLLVQEGISLKMNQLPCVVETFHLSLESFRKIVKDLKDTDSWNPKCDDAVKALDLAYGKSIYDVCEVLIQEGVAGTMQTLDTIIFKYQESAKTVKKLIQNLKDTDNWDPNCEYALKALYRAYDEEKFDLCDVLIWGGVSVTMNHLLIVTSNCKESLETVKQAIQTWKDTDNWNPKCDDATEMLVLAYLDQRYDVCNVLKQEGVSLKMKDFPFLLLPASLECAMNVIQHLKDTDQWDPKSDYAVNILVKANSWVEKDIYDLLIKEGVCHP